jgi:myo-inositol-1(or 4)-monophosphatase
LPESSPAEDLALLTRAAQIAGDIALTFWRKSPRAWEKPDGGGPVTEADMAVNAYLEKALKAARPGYGWLSEESPDTAARAACESVFIVDPIDGTRAFMAGEPTFAVALAVARAGAISAGVVFLPALGKLYAASCDAPASLNGAPIAPAEWHADERPKLLTGRPCLDPEKWIGPVPEIERHFRPSLAYRLCLVADGSFDGVLSFWPCWEWDIAAGSLIVQQAGGAASGPGGVPLRFNQHPLPRSTGLWAASTALHAAFATRMA